MSDVPDPNKARRFFLGNTVLCIKTKNLPPVKKRCGSGKGCMFKKKEHVAAAEPETIERGRKLLMMQLLVIPAAELLASLEGEALAPAA